MIFSNEEIILSAYTKDNKIYIVQSLNLINEINLICLRMMLLI